MDWVRGGSRAPGPGPGDAEHSHFLGIFPLSIPTFLTSGNNFAMPSIAGEQALVRVCAEWGVSYSHYSHYSHFLGNDLVGNSECRPGGNPWPLGYDGFQETHQAAGRPMAQGKAGRRGGSRAPGPGPGMAC